MAAQIINFSKSRTLYLISYADLASEPFHAPFAVFLPAYQTDEIGEPEAIVSSLITLGVVEFCCVGPHAGQLEDLIDYIIEDLGAYDVITTACTDATEGCEYFISVAAGGPQNLVALTYDNDYLASKLINLAHAHGEC